MRYWLIQIVFCLIQIFDPTLKKKKKKKKTTFDIEAALAEGTADTQEGGNEGEAKEEEKDDENIDLDLDFTRKKKKKKKPFSTEELDAALPDVKDDENVDGVYLLLENVD